MSQEVGLRTDAYAVLFVHPTAPTELLASMYWALAGDLQKRRAAGQHVNDELHHLTRAYECVADADSRAAYDTSLGFDTQPLTVRPLPPARRSLRGRLLRRPGQRPIDLYEAMGVARNVSPEHLQSAYRIMRDQYLRLRGKRQKQLLDALDKSYETLTSPDARDRYDGRASEPLPDLLDSSDTAREPASKAASAAPANEVTSPSLAAKAVRLLARVAWFAIITVAAALRLAYQGVSSVVSKAYAKWRKSPPRRVTRPTANRPPPAPVAHTQRDQTRRAPAEVEDKFLGRVATSVQESESHQQAADSDPGSAESL